MNIVHAIWEKRNSGLNTYEVTIEKNDTNFAKIYDLKKSCEYIVVRINNGDIKKNSELENNGFNFLETRMSISLSLNKYKFSEDICKFIEKNPVVENIVQSKKDLDEIIKLVPNMFISDRISLDPMLNENVSENRYKNWLFDMDKNEAITLYTLKTKQNTIGFYSYSVERNSMNAILGGISNKFSGSGLGFFLIVNPIKKAIKLDLSYLNTVISSNNLPVLRLYSKFGFQIKNIEYVFRWIK